MLFCYIAFVVIAVMSDSIEKEIDAIMDNEIK